jgi:hypothetical protein
MGHCPHFLGAKVNLGVEKVVAQLKYPAEKYPAFSKSAAH